MGLVWENVKKHTEEEKTENVAEVQVNEEGTVCDYNGVDYIIKKRVNNDELICHLTTVSTSLTHAIDDIDFSPFTINTDLAGHLVNMRMTIDKITNEIMSGTFVIQEANVITRYYYQLYYFFNRKNNGSFYVVSPKHMSEFVDEDAFLEYLAENAEDEEDQVLVKENMDSICDIRDISKEEYIRG